MYDLVHNFKDKRILLVKGNFAHDFVKNSVYYEQLLPRIDFTSPEDASKQKVKMENYQKVHEGTHVLIDFRNNARLAYVIYLPAEFICSYPKRDLIFSKDSLTEVQVSYAYRKGFAFKTDVDKVTRQAQKQGPYSKSATFEFGDIAK